MVVTVDDVLIELRADSVSEEDEAFLEKKIEEYTERAERINPVAPEHVKDEYIMAGVLQAYMSLEDGNIRSFSDGRFSVTKASIMESPAMDRLRMAILKLQGIRVFHRGDDEEKEEP